MRHLFLILVLVSVWGISPFVAHAASFSLSPKPPTIGVGCSGVVNIGINAGGVPVNAGNVFVAFDAGKLSNIQILPGSFFESYADAGVSGSQARITGFSTSKTPGGSGLFAQVRFKAAAVGTADFSVLFQGQGVSADSNIASAQTSDDLLSGGGSARLTITNEPCAAPPKPSAAPAAAKTPASCAEIGCTTELLCPAVPEASTPPPDMAKACPDASGLHYYREVLPFSTVTSSRIVEGETPRFSAFQKRAALPRSRAERVTVTAGLPFFLTMNDASFLEQPREVQLLLDGVATVLVHDELDGGYFEAALSAPDTAGIYTAGMVYLFSDGAREVWPFAIEVIEPPHVAGVRASSGEGDITVHVFTREGPWDAEAYGQANPLILPRTASRFHLLLPEGSYRLEAAAEGHQTIYMPWKENKGFFLDSLSFTPKPDGSWQSWGAYLGSVLQNGRHHPVVADIWKWSQVALLGFGLLVMLLFRRHHKMFWIYLWHRFRGQWHRRPFFGTPGVVYNAKNDEALSGAVLRAYAPDGRLVAFCTSTRKGEVQLLLPKGVFRVRVEAVGYQSQELDVSVAQTIGLYRPKFVLEPRHSTRLERGYPYAFIWLMITAGLLGGFVVSVGLLPSVSQWVGGGFVLWYAYLNRLAHLLLRRHWVG